jgi:hypothetical protein
MDAACGSGSAAAAVATLDVAGPCFAEFCRLWEAGELCDVALEAGDAAEPLLAHRQALPPKASCVALLRERQIPRDSMFP